jgi:hypothetical protein
MPFKFFKFYITFSNILYNKYLDSLCIIKTFNFGWTFLALDFISLTLYKILFLSINLGFY